MDQQTKNFIVIAVVIAFALLAWYLKKRKEVPSIDNYPFYGGLLPASTEGGAHLSLTEYGDSISVPSNLGTVLANKLGVGVWFDNFAIAGTRLLQWASPYGVAGPSFSLLTMLTQIAQDKHAVIVHRYGMNDALFKTDFNTFKLALIAFVQACRDSGKIPVLVALTKFSGTDQEFIYRRSVINNIIYEVACTQVVHYIDVERVAFDPAIDTPDGLHPSTEYYARLDDYMADQLVAKKIFLVA